MSIVEGSRRIARPSFVCNSICVRSDEWFEVEGCVNRCFVVFFVILPVDRSSLGLLLLFVIPCANVLPFLPPVCLFQ